MPRSRRQSESNIDISKPPFLDEKYKLPHVSKLNATKAALLIEILLSFCPLEIKQVLGETLANELNNEANWINLKQTLTESQTARTSRASFRRASDADNNNTTTETRKKARLKCWTNAKESYQKLFAVLFPEYQRGDVVANAINELVNLIKTIAQINKSDLNSIRTTNLNQLIEQYTQNCENLKALFQTHSSQSNSQFSQPSEKSSDKYIQIISEIELEQLLNEQRSVTERVRSDSAPPATPPTPHRQRPNNQGSVQTTSTTTTTTDNTTTTNTAWNSVAVSASEKNFRQLHRQFGAERQAKTNNTDIGVENNDNTRFRSESTPPPSPFIGRRNQRPKGSYKACMEQMGSTNTTRAAPIGSGSTMTRKTKTRFSQQRPPTVYNLSGMPRTLPEIPNATNTATNNTARNQTTEQTQVQETGSTTITANTNYTPSNQS